MRRVRFAPAALLVVVAIQQLCLVFAFGLAPWSGGGFGMFSTTDAGAARHLHAFVLRPGLERETRVPDALLDLERRALTLPSDRNLAALAHGLAALPSPDYGDPTAVRIQVWRTEFAPDSLAPTGRLHEALEVSPKP